jgi:hypothetical protein
MMTREEAAAIELAVARVVAEERRRVRFEFDRELAVLRQQIAGAETEIAALRKDLIEARSVDDAADVSLDNVSFLHRRVRQ